MIQESSKRSSYLIQLGLDFGTSYCKCVVRDLERDKAWVFLPEKQVDSRWPFLLPSTLKYCNGMISLTEHQYDPLGLPHVKLALASVAKEEYENEVLIPFKKALRNATDDLGDFVKACAVFLLGNIIGQVYASLSRPEYCDGFGNKKDDRLEVALAVPVADIEFVEVEHAFQEVLEKAFEMKLELERSHDWPLEKIRELIPGPKDAGDVAKNDDDLLRVYPEVSAAVQGFIRSPTTSKYGLYCFTETGAGTVDQGVFLHVHQKGEDPKLTYLHASIHELGSRQIERRAAEATGNTDPAALDDWRQKKEDGLQRRALGDAIDDVAKELAKHAYDTLFLARRKLPCKEQFSDINLLFGGGGHQKNPYELGVRSVFKGPKLNGSRVVEPQVVGFPIPKDLEPAGQIETWMRRLWVAYGLSFYSGDFPQHKFPSGVPQQIVSPRVKRVREITKDDV